MHGSDQCIRIENVRDNTTVDVQYSNRYGTKIRIRYRSIQYGTGTVVIQYTDTIRYSTGTVRYSTG